MKEVIDKDVITIPKFIIVKSGETLDVSDCSDSNSIKLYGLFDNEGNEIVGDEFNRVRENPRWYEYTINKNILYPPKARGINQYIVVYEKEVEGYVIENFNRI